MDLLQNPFYILTASPRDDRRHIMELADDRSLLLDSNECMNARSDLTTPRKRLSAEIAWLPGIGPKRAKEVLTVVETSPLGLLAIDNLSSMARSNLLAAGLTRLPAYNADNIVRWILALSLAFEGVEPEGLRVIINDERVVSGFPEVLDLSAIEVEIQERRRHYRQVIKSALDNLSSKELVKAVTEAVDIATNEGEEQGPVLITDLVDSYEIEAQEFLDKEGENIKVLVDKLRVAVEAKQSDAVLDSKVNKLIQVVKNWDTVAQPIQVSTKGRGLSHDASRHVAKMVRDLAIYMFNEHDKLDLSKKITTMLQEVFAEVVEVAELTAEDANTLGDIAERRKLSSLLDPISELCVTAIESAEKDPFFADKVAQRVLNTAPKLIANLVASKPSAEIISQGKDEIALALMCCAIAYGNKTEKWKSCIVFLDEAFKYASSEKVKSAIRKNLNTVKSNDQVYGGLTPISSAPGLYTVNGIGTTMYGLTDYDPSSSSYLSTYYFVFFAIPLFPIRRYRVIPIDNGYRFLGKAPLRTFDKWHIAIFLGLVFLTFIGMQ